MSFSYRTHDPKSIVCRAVLQKKATSRKRKLTAAGITVELHFDLHRMSVTSCSPAVGGVVRSTPVE